jgi:hypothetical protein
MKPKLSLIIQLFALLFFAQNVSAQMGITSITTIGNDAPTADTIFNRKGAGVRSGSAGLSGRWDSVGTNFKLVYNAGTNDVVSISDINIASIGTGTRIPVSAIAKVKRVANIYVNHAGDHFPYFVASNASPLSSENTGTFLLNGPEVVSMENAMISNNINIGFDNVFQNNLQNVHYANIERVDYIIPNGLTTNVNDDLNYIGFTIYDRGVGDDFKIAGIKNLNINNEVADYMALVKTVTASDFGDNLLATNIDYTIFQRDPNFNGSESRPSVNTNENMRGVFISLASLGFVSGQTVYGFSLFDSDINNTNTDVHYLLDYQNFPTNTNSTNMLDLVNSIGMYNFNKSVLSSPTVLNASLQNEKVLLQWSTASLADAQKIYLQRASGNMVYSNLAEINSNQLSFVDESTREDIVYYRLKIITVSGVVKYSNIQLIRSKISDTQIFPTVANDQLYITSNSIAVNKPIAIAIYNVDGKLIQSISKTASRSMSVDVAYLKKAMYIICITQNNEVVIRQKFIKN